MRYEKRIMAAMAIASNRAYSRNLQYGSGGNLSARIQGSKYMIVKTSGGSFDDCHKNGAGWTVTDFEGNLKPGAAGKPTREVLLHGFLYKELQHVGGIMHTHSPCAVAWSIQNTRLPCMTWHSKLKLSCSEVPILDIHAAVVPRDELAKIGALFRAFPMLPAFILKGHGIVAVGNDILEAEHTAELVEETARVALLIK